METHHQLINWLRDAHAMERSVAAALERHAADAREYPELQDQLERHLQETREHARRIEGCLEQLNATPSTVKDVAANFVGAVQGMAGALFRDDVLKNLLSEYAMEHFGIASYSALVAAAEDAGLIDIAHTCSELLREETRMALWIEEQIPKLTRRHLQAGASATG